MDLSFFWHFEQTISLLVLFVFLFWISGLFLKVVIDDGVAYC